MDVITYLCFGQPMDAINEPDFKAPLIGAMHAGTLLVPIFVHFKIIRKWIMDCPPELAIAMSPDTAGLINMQQVSKAYFDKRLTD